MSRHYHNKRKCREADTEADTDANTDTNAEWSALGDKARPIWRTRCRGVSLGVADSRIVYRGTTNVTSSLIKASAPSTSA